MERLSALAGASLRKGVCVLFLVSLLCTVLCGRVIAGLRRSDSSSLFFEHQRQAMCSSRGVGIRYQSWRHRGISRRRFQLPPNLFNNVIADYCTPSDVGKIQSDRVVAVTAIDAKHFEEAQDLIRSFRTCLPNHMLVMVGMDLPEHMAEKVKRMCNVRYVNFDFEKYPDYVHFIGEYRFKPLVVHNVLFDKWNVVGFKPDAVFWVDASVRFLCRTQDRQNRKVSAAEDFSNRWTRALALVDQIGVGWFTQEKWIAYYFIPNSMLKYLPTTLSDQNQLMPGCSSVLFSRSQPHLDSIVMWWVACALDPNCMLDKTWTPKDRWHTGNPSISKGSKYHLECFGLGEAQTILAEASTPKLVCSRPDQSALNVLCVNVNGRVSNAPPVTMVKREPTMFYRDDVIETCELDTV